jgi:hypothetical protein
MRLFSAIFLFLVLLSASAVFPEERSSMVSLRDYEWAKHYPWVTDFEYERTITEAQRQEVVAYSIEMKARHVRSLRERELPWVLPAPSADENFVIGLSRGWPEEPETAPLPIFGYMITDPEIDDPKLRIVLVGSNHAREHPACWTLHAMVEFLVSDDPRAQALRREAVFYVYPVVNPDGKTYLYSEKHRDFLTVNGSPEIVAAGENNHNRLWDTDGDFVSIDTAKAAMIRDTGGKPDYLIDFHGIPRSSYVFSCDVAASSPLSRALAGRAAGMTQRVAGHHPGMLRSWAISEEGLGARYGLTPEIANSDKEGFFQNGLFFALAFYDVITNRIPSGELDVPVSDVEARRPSAPRGMWFFEGDANDAVNGAPEGVVSHATWSNDVRFEYPGNRSLELDGRSTFVDFGQTPPLDATEALTVALWVRGSATPAELRYIIGRYAPAADQRSWTIAQLGGTGEVIVILSADGGDHNDRIKRTVSTLWPFSRVFNGEWRHVAFTFQGGGDGELRLFLDGVELRPDGRAAHVLSVGSVPALFSSDAPVLLGAGAGPNRFFEGLVDEVAVWDSALSPGEIRWLFENSARQLR